MSNQLYVGRNVADPHNGVVFEYHQKPTMESHGYGSGKVAKFDYVIGPFRTRQGAEFMAGNGYLNPNCQTVEDAERLAKVARKVQS